MITKRVKFIYLSFILSVASFLIYNILREFGSTELFFFGLSLLLFIAFVLLFFYSVMEFIMDKQPADLWKVGFLGLLGVLGLIPGLTPLFAIFAFFVLFGMKDYY